MNGKCFDMCPKEEVEFRITNNIIHCLEATQCGSKMVADPNKMVKEYSRSAADTHKSRSLHLLRPISVLHTTVDYLTDLYRGNIDTDKEIITYSFVCDRLRAVRQDFIIQRIKGNRIISLLEKMLYFYIETYDRYLNRDYKTFEPVIHETQIEECFKRWAEEIEFYNDMVKIDDNIAVCYFIRKANRSSSVIQELFNFKEYLSLKVFNNIYDLLLCIYSNNFIKFFKLFSNFHNIVQCCLIDTVIEIRQKSMKTISLGFKSPVARLPISLISQWLGYSDHKHFRTFLSFYCDINDDCDTFQVASIKIPQFDRFSKEERQFLRFCSLR